MICNNILIYIVTYFPLRFTLKCNFSSDFCYNITAVKKYILM